MRARMAAKGGFTLGALFWGFYHPDRVVARSFAEYQIRKMSRENEPGQARPAYLRVSRQPAASASSTEQNQRVPLLICILICAYQRLFVVW